MLRTKLLFLIFFLQKKGGQGAPRGGAVLPGRGGASGKSVPRARLDAKLVERLAGLVNSTEV